MRLSYRFGSSSPEERDVYGPDRGDEWDPTSSFFQRVLDHLPARWVCLGGDTHIAYAAALSQARGGSAIFCSSGMQRETTMRLWRQRLGFGFPWPWARRQPEIVTDTLQLRYLPSEVSDDGVRYEYFCKNNIGELRFELRDLDHVTACHALWWRSDAGDSIAAVSHRIEMTRGTEA